MFIIIASFLTLLACEEASAPLSQNFLPSCHTTDKLITGSINELMCYVSQAQTPDMWCSFSFFFFEKETFISSSG